MYRHAINKVTFILLFPILTGAPPGASYGAQASLRLLGRVLIHHQPSPWRHHRLAHVRILNLGVGTMMRRISIRRVHVSIIVLPVVQYFWQQRPQRVRRELHRMHEHPRHFQQPRNQGLHARVDAARGSWTMPQCSEPLWRAAKCADEPRMEARSKVESAQQSAQMNNARRLVYAAREYESRESSVPLVFDFS